MENATIDICDVLKLIDEETHKGLCNELSYEDIIEQIKYQLEVMEIDHNGRRLVKAFSQ